MTLDDFSAAIAAASGRVVHSGPVDPPAGLSQPWHRTAGTQWTRADRRARVTQDTYQPVWTAETADGSRRRCYRTADALAWADRWPALGPTL